VATTTDSANVKLTTELDTGGDTLDIAKDD
jgi:hypothetical protein